MSKKILIVEDNQDCSEFLTFLVGRLGYEAIPVHTGEEAIVQATANPPHLIFMDLGLPGIDGIEAAAAIRQHPETTGIPIVALSARSEAASKQKASDAGITMYLIKPAPPAVIKETIEKFITGAANPDAGTTIISVDVPQMPRAVV